jgi:hypothetical protein
MLVVLKDYELPKEPWTLQFESPLSILQASHIGFDEIESSTNPIL